jgi:hypothetical protein
MVLVTVLVLVLITERVVPPKFGTYARVPSGERLRPRGLLPTTTVPVTVSVAVLIIETLPPS